MTTDRATSPEDPPQAGYQPLRILRGSEARSPQSGPPPAGRPAANPCLTIFGPGPQGRLCGECANLRADHVLEPSASGGQRGDEARLRRTGPPPKSYTHFYCTFSAGDRRVTAPACSRFEEPSPINRTTNLRGDRHPSRSL